MTLGRPKGSKGKILSTTDTLTSNSVTKSSAPPRPVLNDVCPSIPVVVTCIPKRLILQEDTLLPGFSDPRYHMVQPHREFGGMPSGLVSHVLMTWDFVTAFARMFGALQICESFCKVLNIFSPFLVFSCSIFACSCVCTCFSAGTNFGCASDGA